MSARLWVQPSSLSTPNAQPAGSWYRGVPVPGIEGAPPAATGIASCSDLLFSSPPTLLEQYEIYSYSIGWGVVVAAASAPIIGVELALLINDEVAYVDVQEGIQTVAAGPNFVASGAWSSDLVNPIVVGARERLKLRAGVQSNELSSASGWLAVGIQATPTSWEGYDSTVSYYTRQLSPVRQL